MDADDLVSIENYLRSKYFPLIITGPGNVIASPGSTGTFVVVASQGSAHFNYQWLENSTNIPGATNASYTTPILSTNDNGETYTVEVILPGVSTNLSNPATLTVPSAPEIASDVQPSSLVLLVGETAVFSVTAAGDAPLSYQWQLNATNLTDNGRIIGSQTSTLTIANCQLSDSGGYQLMVTNSFGATNSSSASLTVTLIGFNNGVDWSANNGPSFANDALTLTNGAGSEWRSSWLNEPVDVIAFLASWTYQDVGCCGADGTAFVLQNCPAGTAALGGAGGALGYVGGGGNITNSIAFEFNIFSAYGVGIAIGTNGLGSNATATLAGPYFPTGLLNIASGNPIGVTLQYLNGVASLTLTDSVQQVSFATNYALNVTNFVRSNTAYIGFTGSDGGVASTQIVSNFFFGSLPTVAARRAAGGSLVLTWPVGTAGFVLQQTSSLSSPNWVNLTNVPTVAGGQNEITLTPSAATEFYRLSVQ